MAMVAIITEVTATAVAVIKAITITNTTNITHMMMTHMWSNMAPSWTLCGGFNHSPKDYFKGEHNINNLMEKMSLGPSNPHQSGLYQ